MECICHFHYTFAKSSAIDGIHYQNNECNTLLSKSLHTQNFCQSLLQFKSFATNYEIDK